MTQPLDLGYVVAAGPFSSWCRALKDGKEADASDLCAELINLGVVVRDPGSKQCRRWVDRRVES